MMEKVKKMGNVRRIYVEKKDAYAVKGKELLEEISGYLSITSVSKVRELIRYDVENISDATFEVACKTVFSEPPVDVLYLETFAKNENDKVFSVEYLPGQLSREQEKTEKKLEKTEKKGLAIICYF